MKLILITTICLMLTACTISLQNISTHGTAQDLVDETTENTPTVNPTINIPIPTL